MPHSKNRPATVITEVQMLILTVPYRYKLFHTNSADRIEDQLPESIAHTIEIEFENKDKEPSNG